MAHRRHNVVKFKIENIIPERGRKLKNITRMKTHMQIENIIPERGRKHKLMKLIIITHQVD